MSGTDGYTRQIKTMHIWLAAIIAIVIPLVTGGAMYGSIMAEIKQNTEAREKVEKTLKEHDKKLNVVHTHNAIVDQKFIELSKDLAEINLRLSKMEEDSKSYFNSIIESIKNLSSRRVTP